jgi:formylglycine-generating enzyme required for sulfatase activity
MRKIFFSLARLAIIVLFSQISATGFGMAADGDELSYDQLKACLQQEKEIEKKRDELKSTGSLVQRKSEEVSAKVEKINQEKASLDTSNVAAVDAYNRKVEQQRVEVSSFEQQQNAYHELLTTHNNNVKAYNKNCTGKQVSSSDREKINQLMNNSPSIVPGKTENTKESGVQLQTQTAQLTSGKKTAEQQAAAQAAAEKLAAEQQAAERAAAERLAAEQQTTIQQPATSGERQVEDPQVALARYHMVRIAGGCFQMGDGSGNGNKNEQPQHEVCVGEFMAGKYEVTQKEWKDVMGQNPSSFQKGDNYPVEMVSWDDVQEFLRRLKAKTGVTFRLPTEAEWEYAAKSGGKTLEFATSTGALERRLANYGAEECCKENINDGYDVTAPVGSYPANGLGLFDMTGNVWEWCADGYAENSYASSERNNPRGDTKGPGRVFRGGGWNSNPKLARTTKRNWLEAGAHDNSLGFRLFYSAPALD